MVPSQSRALSADEMRDAWSLRPDVTYLNHGSFGPSPNEVRAVRRQWLDRLEEEPWDFFVRRLHDELAAVRRCLGEFVGAAGDDLVLVDNATTAMNIVAANTPLGDGDEVLLTDHEYGAVHRLWQRTCDRAGARLVVQSLPWPIKNAQQLVDRLFDGVTLRTRMIVTSHVTSPTAVILPVAEICRRAGERDIRICIDGPHAVAMIPLDLRRLGCDYYTASCHKWLSGPFGTGFLYVDPRHQASIEPVVVSWGHMPDTNPSSWQDEFGWIGTRDPTPLLALPAAIDFLRRGGLRPFRQRTHELARHARRSILEQFGLPHPVPDDAMWYGSMVSIPIPAVEAAYCQRMLWERERIEVPIVDWQGNCMVRVSCHLYNTRAQLDRLRNALAQLVT